MAGTLKVWTRETKGFVGRIPPPVQLLAVAPVPASAATGLESDDEISLLDLLQVVADNLRLLVLGPLAVGVLALGISFLVSPTYTAKTQFLPPQQQQSAAASMLALDG